MDKFKRNATSVLLALLSATVSAINMNIFVDEGGLVPSGFSGLSLLLVRLGDKFWNINLNYSVLYLLFNIPCALLVYKSIGKKFTLISLIDIVMSSVLVAILPNYTLTDDLLLISVFGGILAGLSAILILQAGGCGGGMSFLAIYFSKKTSKSMWNMTFAFNVVMMLIAGIIFGWEYSLYSIIYQFVDTQVLNMFDNRYKRSCFFIVTDDDKAEEIAQAVYKEFNHSCTKLEGIGTYSDQNRTVLYTIVGTYEQKQFIEVIQQIDPKAFIYVINSEKVVGNFIEKPF